MSNSTGMILPGSTCPAAAYHRDHSPHIFYCDLPREHDGRHGHEAAPGVWVNWDVTISFESAPPPNPADWPHPHMKHAEGEWLYACCACSGLYDPGCSACNPGPSQP